MAQTPPGENAFLHHLHQHTHLAVTRGTIANAPYSSRPPSPPYIHIPSLIASGQTSMSIVPSFTGVVDSTRLTEADLRIITQDKIQIAQDASSNWRYEARREAQPILDFLYLGPSSVAKDRAFLEGNGITMLLAVRDARMAQARLMSVERTAQALGLVAEYVDVAGPQEMIQALPLAVQKINDHLLDVYRSQAVQIGSGSGGNANANGNGNGTASNGLEDGQIVIDNATFRRGKVLVFCETGNDRSAAIVAAYIMAVFGMDLVRTLQFIGLQRFCATFDDETKHMLQAYEDILAARRAVSRDMGQGFSVAGSISSSAAGSGGRNPSKRGIEETIDAGDEDEGQGGPFALDRDRYTDRPEFVPFADGDINME
ncbi:uncharacterized protein E0L32_011405 [Thyridium curvatum]|uniref:Tyrosine specific protein phosphatases domain-containing protein n=1 Tax=Thyridium curvatum TaxID=1093900 RepID=A0A507BG62_9PEZI|nr:uncharacterized protein E0L32_011405 [Thyridium curvatum]TPX18927.1 hypothetical protein E0L32_011405 [Thyridium curvatum]